MDEVIKIYKALADKSRLRILKLLEIRAFCVCELTCVLRIAQSSVSEHLKILKDAGLVEDKKESYFVNYYLTKHAESKLARNQLKFLSRFLNADNVIERDRKRAKSINREKICAK